MLKADQNATSEAGQQTSAATQLTLVLCVAITVVALAEWASSRLLAEPAGADAPEQVSRPANVRILLKDPAKLPAPTSARSLWLIGNSHTYALPGMRQGDALRT